MKDISRRRLLAVGVLGRTATLAGCLQGPTGDGATTPDGTDASTRTPGHTAVATTDAGAEPGTETPSASPPDVRIEADSVAVELASVTDGAVTVDARAAVDAASRVAYTAPVETTFELRGTWGGTSVPGDGGPLVVSRTLPLDGPPAGFVAPVYRESEGFEYRVYANRAFRDAFDWHLTGSSERRIRKGGDRTTRSAAFEEHAPGVYRDVFRPTDVGADPTDPLTVAVTNYTVAEILDDRPSEVAGVSLVPATGGVDETVPQVRFGFVKTETGYELRHAGGDTVDADHLLVSVDGDPAATQFEGTVAAGSSIALNPPQGAEVLVSYVAEGTQTTLAVFTVGERA
ncbi:hypothetical protein [Halomarina rubra]|uniref:Uncharacterized protein n=1 Tax=Halomarina rubra TaxID=2071873 RepID=A0ABD6B058_9EURY|nr:hypothetical protein [Halomarina rubra]